MNFLCKNIFSKDLFLSRGLYTLVLNERKIILPRFCVPEFLLGQCLKNFFMVYFQVLHDLLHATLLSFQFMLVAIKAHLASYFLPHSVLSLIRYKGLRLEAS